jgi:hypothetical protein
MPNSKTLRSRTTMIPAPSIVPTRFDAAAIHRCGRLSWRATA